MTTPNLNSVPILIDHVGVARTAMHQATLAGTPKDQQIASIMWAQVNWLAALYQVMRDIRDAAKVTKE
jgi:hypothetical protein